jgi:hypothetical protein
MVDIILPVSTGGVMTGEEAEVFLEQLTERFKKTLWFNGLDLGQDYVRVLYEPGHPLPVNVQQEIKEAVGPLRVEFLPVAGMASKKLA